MKIGYARVSTKDHAYGLQIDALLAAGRQAGRVAVAGWLRKVGDESPAWDKQEAGNPVRYIISLNVLNRESKGWHQPSAAKLQPVLNLTRQGND